MKLRSKSLGRLNRMVDQLAYSMEKMNLTEYIRYLNSSKRMLWINFTSGLARGLGIAIGFTLLGALVIYILQKSAILNIPVIGDFIAEIVKIVQEHPKIR